jgi:hypothetical protein
MGPEVHWRSVDDFPGPEFWSKQLLVCWKYRNGERRVATYLFTENALRQIGWNEITHWAPMPEPPELDTPAV